jgi:hypothetical protein
LINDTGHLRKQETGGKWKLKKEETMAKKNNKKSRPTQKSTEKPSKESNKRHPKGWDQDTSADIPYDDSIESPRSHQTPSMY